MLFVCLLCLLGIVLMMFFFVCWWFCGLLCFVLVCVNVVLCLFIYCFVLALLMLRSGLTLFVRSFCIAVV